MCVNNPKKPGFENSEIHKVSSIGNFFKMFPCKNCAAILQHNHFTTRIFFSRTFDKFDFFSQEIYKKHRSDDTQKIQKYDPQHDTLTSAQPGSRTSRQIHDAIYAHIATIQQNKQNGISKYC